MNERMNEWYNIGAPALMETPAQTEHWLMIQKMCHTSARHTLALKKHECPLPSSLNPHLCHPLDMRAKDGVALPKMQGPGPGPIPGIGFSEKWGPEKYMFGNYF